MKVDRGPVFCGANKGVCVCSNSRNDVPRVAQLYGTIAHTPGAVRPSTLCL